MDATAPSTTGTHQTSVVRLQKIFVPTLYEFLPEGQKDIITAFHHSDAIGSARCSYNPAEHMFEIQCVPIHSFNAANVLLRVQKEFFEKETGQRRSTKSSSLKIKRIAAANINHEDLDDSDSLADSSALSQDDNILKPADPAFKIQWKPADSSVGMMAVMTSNILQKLSELTGCVININEAANSVTITGDDIDKVNNVKEKLNVIEKIRTETTFIGHIAEVEGDTTKIKIHLVRVVDVDDGTMGRLLLHDEFDMFRKSDSKLSFPENIGAKFVPRHSKYNVGRQEWKLFHQRVSPIVPQMAQSSAFCPGLIWRTLRSEESRPYPAQVPLESPSAVPSGVAIEQWLHAVDPAIDRRPTENRLPGDAPKADRSSEILKSNTGPRTSQSSQLEEVRNTKASSQHTMTPSTPSKTRRDGGPIQTVESWSSGSHSLTKRTMKGSAATVIPRTREETPAPQNWGSSSAGPFQSDQDNFQDNLIDLKQQTKPWIATADGSKNASNDKSASKGGSEDIRPEILEQIRRNTLRKTGKKFQRSLVDISMPTIVDRTPEGQNEFQEFHERNDFLETGQSSEIFGDSPSILIDALQPVTTERMLPSEEEEVSKRVFRPTHRYQKPSPNPKWKKAPTGSSIMSAATRNLRAIYDEGNSASPVPDKSTTSQSRAGSARLRRPFEELPPTTSLGQLIDGCKRSIDRARLISGYIDIAMQIGQILLPKRAPHRDDPTITLAQFPNSLTDIKGFESETGCFTPMTTSSTSDILSLLAQHGNSNESQASAPKAWFEFTCSTADKREVIMQVDALETQEQQPYLLCGKSLLGAVYLHFPQKTFDSRLVVRAAEKESVESVNGARELLDNLQIKIMDNGLPSLRGQETPVFQVEKLRLHTQASYDIAGFKETAYLQITQVKDLQIIHPLTNMRGVFAADLEDDHKMIDNGSLWYELCVLPVDPPQEFEENKTLEYGDEASWTTESVMSDNMKYKLRQMEELTRKVIFSMEGVGYHNVGPAAGKEKQIRARKAELAAKPDEFW